MACDYNINYHETRESFDPGKHGKDFEIEMSKFLFKRLLDMNCKNFKFTREKRGLGKFDDLTVIHEDNDGLWYSLVQLKHILNETKKIDYESLFVQPESYFYLPKYFTYYEESPNSISFDSNFENATLKHLIICTNIGIEENLKDIEKIKIKKLEIINHSGSLFKLSVSHNIKRKVFSECYVSDRDKLAKELCLHFLLNKQIDVSNLIKNEHASMILKFHVLLNLEVIDVHNNCFKEEFLEPDLDKKSYAYSFRNSILRFINEIYLKCKNAEENDLKNMFNLTSKKATSLKMLMNKYLEKNPLEFLRNVKFSIMKGFGEPLLSPNSKSAFSDLKEIDFNILDERIEHFLNKLLFAVDQNKSEFIVRQELISDLYLAYSDKMNDWYYNGSRINDAKKAREREWLSRDKIVNDAMNYVINFQNRNICLSEIINDKSLFNSEILIMVFSKFPIKIANTCGKGSEISNYYISRQLTRQRCIHKSFIKERNTDIIFFSDPHNSLNSNEMDQLIPNDEILFSLSNINSNSIFIQVDDDFNMTKFDDTFYKYHKMYEWENVHWLEIIDGNIFWRKTHGSLNSLQNYIMEENEFVENINEADLLQSTGPIIISGEPGMGKSSLLQHFVENINRRSAPTLIIKILLKNTFYLLDSEKKFKDFDEILNFLAVCGNFTDNVSQLLLKHCILTMKVVFIFDGFDELRTNIQIKKYLTIVNYLKSKFNIKNIWITTRPHKKALLENNFGVISYSLKEITSEEQITFLAKFWAYHTKKPFNNIYYYSKTLISSLNNSLTLHEKEFLGIPLQTYMFATIFMEELKKDIPNISKNLYLTNLFSSFIHLKYDIFLEKLGIASLPSDIKKVLINIFDEIHQNFALCQGGIFSLTYIQKLNIKQYDLEDERILEVGIVYKSNKSFQFIHKTFVEYLIAKRLANLVLNNEKNVYIEEILFKLISVKENKFLLYLFDNEIAENFPQLKYVFHGQLEKVEHMSYEDIQTSDCLGRNLFYYAFQYKHFDIIDILLKKNCSLNNDDNYSLKSIKAYYDYCCMYDINNLNLTDEFFISILDSDFKFALKIVDFFDMKLEMTRKNWKLLEKILIFRQLYKKFSDNISIFKYALKFEAPLDLILIILSCIKMNGDSLENDILSYSNFMKYLFRCKRESIEKLLQIYCDSFDVKPPLYIGVYEYFDLRCVNFGDSFSSLVDLMEKRSMHYSQIVKLLLENGASYVLLSNDDINNIFSESKINLRLINLPVFQFIEKYFKAEYEFFKIPFSDITKYEEQSLPQNILQVLKIFREYKGIIKLEESETLKDAVLHLCTNILKNTEAKYLIYLANVFHKAVLNNKYKLVRQYLKEAKLKMWQKALLKSTNENSKIPEEVAKSQFNVRIYTLLRRRRLSLLT